MTNYKWFLVYCFTAVWIWAAINPVFYHDWLLENYLVFIFVPIILISAHYFKLSMLSYTLITLFMILHVIGSHYTYEHVPFGIQLGHWFGTDRNMYDRLVHFSFGFLLAYPVREVFMRLANVKGFWGYYLPLDLTLSFSAIYEIIEWLTAQNVGSAAGIAFLGAQGDIWDAQKDMLMAGIGALLAMLIIFVINAIYNPRLGRELKESFQIQKGDEPLGEQRLRRWLRSKR
ncbi:MAG: DUF2238 domain-containing protein [Candidatus Doudnabacteria bacterium]|nr:DUF2238 domain-containing protein [Candidatus Doudnabacteria bacterium]